MSGGLLRRGRFWHGALVLVLALNACGGGGGGSTPSTGGGTGATVPLTSTISLPEGVPGQSGTFAAIASGYGGSVSLPPATSGAGTMTLTLSVSLPSTAPTLQSNARLPKAIGGSLNALAYVSFTSTAGVVLSNWPSFSFVLPPGTSVPSGQNLYLGYYSSANASAGWITLAGPATISGSNVTFAAVAGPVPFAANTPYAVALFSTGQTLVDMPPTPIPTATPIATPSPGNVAAYDCPQNDSVASFARAGSGQGMRQMAARVSDTAQPASATTLVAVTYDRSVASANAAVIAAHERTLGLSLVRNFDYGKLNVVQRVVAVPTSALAQIESTLRSQQGVRNVAVTGGRRSLLTVTTPYFPNDPYFNGFGQPLAINGVPPPETYQVPPYEENAYVPGQWDMHAIGLEYAFGYSQPNNGSNANNPNALGTAAIKIAIIDSGADTQHPELAGGKLAYQHCYVTNPAGAQSVTAYSPDVFGHGTDVTGIAAADTGNNLGFAGTGGGTSIYSYRVFPVPDDTCELGGKTPDTQCSASSVDVASAIADAVNQGVNIISMSLGGPSCSVSGVDPDPTENTAVMNAIAANVIVIAASGNNGAGLLSSPACDAGVIAAGASALDDGVTNGSGHTGGSSAAPVEYVASYSNYASPGSAPKSANAWGIVAPGGDASSDMDLDELHWIGNIWTSTPALPIFAAYTCGGDYPLGTGTPDCRTLINGTSMAAPHVAGAAALILAVNGTTYQSPTAMKTLLCSTADDIGDPHEGCGRLNVYRAMAHAVGDSAPP